MDRTKAIDNVAVRPAPSGSTHAAGYFGDGTTVEAEFLNGVMDSLVVPLEDGGITPDTDDYEQFAKLLSGVHGIVTDVRSNLATTGASTHSKRAASAAKNAIADGTYSQCNAGLDQTTHGTYSQCNAGWNQTANGGFSQCNAGAVQTAHGDYSQCNAGQQQHNSGKRASVIGGRYFENIDDNCVCGGYGTSAPSNFGDGLTNKNITWKLHNDTGNVAFRGNATVAMESLSGTCDWDSAASFHNSTSIVATKDVPLYKITIDVVNTSGAQTTISPGDTICLVDFAPAGTIVSGYCAQNVVPNFGNWVVSTATYPPTNAVSVMITRVGSVAHLIASGGGIAETITVYLTALHTTTA